MNWTSKLKQPHIRELIADTKRRLLAEYPDCKFLAIFGSVNYDFSLMPKAEAALSIKLGEQLSKHKFVLLTGGNPVTGIAIGNFSTLPVVHLCPTELTMSSRPARGQVWTNIGATMEDRQMVLAMLTDVALAFGGGPGTRNELEIATLGGSKIVALEFTGGAAAAFPHSNNGAKNNNKQRKAWNRLERVNGLELETMVTTTTISFYGAKLTQIADDVCTCVLL